MLRPLKEFPLAYDIKPNVLVSNESFRVATTNYISVYSMATRLEESKRMCAPFRSATDRVTSTGNIWSIGFKGQEEGQI